MTNYTFEVPEYSFIQFNKEIDCCDCEMVLEVAKSSDISFYIFTSHGFNAYLVDVSGNVISELRSLSVYGALNGANITINDNTELSENLACGECFRIKLDNGFDIFYSNVFIYNPDTNHSLVMFVSENKTYFPFQDGRWMSLRLPVRLANRNPSTEKEEYIDSNGRIWNPYKQRRNKYDLETDYSTDDFHKKLEVILLHDNIMIDDLEINETGDYQINYEDELVENRIKLYKATSEISTQEVTRMRNY